MSMAALDNIITSVATEYRWTPPVISEMFCDDLDHHGLLFWYDHLREQEAERIKQTS